MIRNGIIVLLLLNLTVFVVAQSPKQDYGFTVEKKVSCTPVKSQGRTGTCWSFATASFIESELMRQGKGEHDLSEMFVVRNIYKNKALNYVLRQGKANFSQGSLAHDLMAIAATKGVLPEGEYSGKLDGETRHDHREMEAVLKGMLDGLLKQKRLSNKWKPAFNAVLDAYLGAPPERFTYQGESHDANSLAKKLSINVADYINITSFSHHPFYQKFILEIPDNYSNGSFYNVPLEELETIVDYALQNGYSIAWDGDVSEKGFSSKSGIAIIPEEVNRKDLFEQPGKELAINQKMRQEKFESFATTDDHLMHLVGISKDKNGNKYYLVKNSWGEVSEFKGFLHMSKAYFLLKTVSIMVHKNAIPENIAKKIL